MASSAQNSQVSEACSLNILTLSVEVWDSLYGLQKSDGQIYEVFDTTTEKEVQLLKID